VRSRLDSIIRSPELRKYIQDAVVSLKDGKYVIPVKSEYRKNIRGNVVDTSSSGSTVFIEPEDVSRHMQEYNILKIEEEKEVYRILSELTAMVSSITRELSINMEIMVNYDLCLPRPSSADPWRAGKLK
jgi:dsDNA-specific endonuclease/ATPase MutS2